MKTIKDKQLLMGADWAGFPLKEAVKAHLEKKGWTITDVGVTTMGDQRDNTDLMFHRIGLRIGSLIAEGEFERALVFCGPDGLDELGLAGPSHVAELAADGSVKEYDVDPQALFGATYPVDALRGGAPAENARIAHDVLAGVEKGPYRLAAALNGAAAIVAGGKAETLDAALELAFRAIDSGAALGKLEALVAASRQR